MNWISVKDRLPEEGLKRESTYCIVFDRYNYIMVLPYDHIHRCWNTDDDDDYYTDSTEGNITHWMPLPELPKNK